MAMRMLIDARHSEETRVAVLKGNQIEEFDFESAEHKQIKGNIYLAKVTRVEPSLQAAFVDFGGNRHGFLAFGEIHPDYYQIPAEDRAALLAEEAEVAEEEERLWAEQDDDGGNGDDFLDEGSGEGPEEIDTSDNDRVATIEAGHLENGDDDADERNGSEDEDDDASGPDDEPGTDGREGNDGRRARGKDRRRGGAKAQAVDDARAKRMALRRRYKIQDVIQRRQVLLVQVVKEERGNKGAALTTYLSLAGRYTVLMPNSSHGGGISRKISSGSDRKRLKQIVADLSLPKTMGLIVRTAGLSRTKTEIRRDFDYLARLWDEIREKTLASAAPSLIHSDSDLIRRAIRDLYSREIEEVWVEGDEGYKSAKSFMKLLMPSHARRVKHYADPVPLFQRHGAEDQLKAMYDPVVQLKSGGYLVINPTEALVSIDINSGRSTRELGIEQTAVATNLEAAREIARQLRLRDMAGLIVIDFIDMERSGNTRKVEKCMKEALKNDRARIQVGRISSFGLMEMSRQRLRTGVLEATTRECPHCDGTGLVRTASSAGLTALRQIEDEAAKGRGSLITLAASTEAAVYILNAKRADLQDIETRYGVRVEVVPEGEDEGAKMTVTSSGPRPSTVPKFEPIRDEDEEDEDEELDEASYEEDEAAEPRRNRRRRRGGSRTQGKSEEAEETDEATASAPDDRPDDEDGGTRPRRKRRGRRGGRGRAKRADRSNGEANGEAEDKGEGPIGDELSDQLKDDIAVVAGPDGAAETAEAMARKEGDDTGEAPDEGQDTASSDAAPDDAPPKKKRPARGRRKTAAEPKEEGGKPAADAADGVPAKARRGRKDSTSQDRANDNDEAQSDLAPASKAREELREGVKESMTVIAGPDDTPETAEAAARQEGPRGDSAKPRKGWWQRTFGE
jgi:ribonuclease E